LLLTFLGTWVFFNYWIYELIDSGLVNPNIPNHKTISEYP